MCWQDETCSRCTRATQTTHVDDFGRLCIVCLDLLAEGDVEVELDA